MGEVWRAYDTTIDRFVALKVLPANFADDPVFQERFRREARAAAGLDEPHVVPIHDFGEIDGRLYVTMRLIKGRDLQAVLTDGPLSAERAVRIIEQVAQAVHAAHTVGLVHRDIKPSNILLDENDFAYLIDFGIARTAGETGLTATGSMIGTLSYMAPERFSSGQADARSDIYALACVLYECLTGSQPFPGDSLEQQLAGHLTVPPPRPSRAHPGVPTELDRVIATGMAKNPGERYATTVELARAARNATTVPLPRPRPAAPLQSPNRPIPTNPFHGQDTRLAASRSAPVLQPSPGPPLPQPRPKQKRPLGRPGVVIPALVAMAALIGGGVFAAVKVSQRNDDHTPSSTAAPNTAVSSTAESSTTAPTTGPFTGDYTADFAAATDIDGKPVQGGTATTETWAIRSVCRSNECVATASRRSGETTQLSTFVFDEVGGGWLAVGLYTGTCQNAPHEYWEVITLQPRPDGTLSGEHSVTSNNGCYSKRAVTFTRTGDVDVTSLSDPASQPPRVVSPAEALHGRYRWTQTNSNGKILEGDYAVRTDCLRTGDRCMSFFHTTGTAWPLVFGSGKWTWNVEFDSQGCHVKSTAEYPLPTPPQDPITLLTGHGRHEETGSACNSYDFDEKYARTGD